MILINFDVVEYDILCMWGYIIAGQFYKLLNNREIAMYNVA